MLALKARLSKTIVVVTHEIFEALTLGDRIAVMQNGPIEQVGSKEEIMGAPKTPFVRDLFAKPAAQLSLLSNGPR